MVHRISSANLFANFEVHVAGPRMPEKTGIRRRDGQAVMKGKDLANRGIVSGGAVESRKVCTLRRLLSNGSRYPGRRYRGKFQLKSGGDRRMVLTSTRRRRCPRFGDQLLRFQELRLILGFGGSGRDLVKAFEVTYVGLEPGKQRRRLLVGLALQSSREEGTS